jgi:hypothetical protein
VLLCRVGLVFVKCVCETVISVLNIYLPAMPPTQPNLIPLFVFHISVETDFVFLARNLLANYIFSFFFLGIFLIKFSSLLMIIYICLGDSDHRFKDQDFYYFDQFIIDFII